MLIYCGSTNQAFKLSYPSVREMAGLCVHWAYVMSIISYNQGLEKIKSSVQGHIPGDTALRVKTLDFGIKLRCGSWFYHLLAIFHSKVTSSS